MIQYANRCLKKAIPLLSIGRQRSEEFNAIVLAQATGEVMEIVEDVPSLSVAPLQQADGYRDTPIGEPFGFVDEGYWGKSTRR